MNTSNPFLFLLDTAFDILTMLLLLRYLLQWVGADFYNPLSQFIVKVTNPVVTPVYNLLALFAPDPNKQRGNGEDNIHQLHNNLPKRQLLSTGAVALFLAYDFILIKLVLIATLAGIQLSAVALLLGSAHDLITLIITVFIFAVFIQVILSWLNPDPRNPVIAILNSLTAPVLTPVRRFVKPISGLDLSPIVALIGLMFLDRLVTYLFQMI